MKDNTKQPTPRSAQYPSSEMYNYSSNMDFSRKENKSAFQELLEFTNETLSKPKPKKHS